MSTVWLVEARRHLGPFAAAITVGGLLGAARLLFTPVTFDVFFQLFSMLAWTVLAGYAFSVVYGYFFLGRDVFLHLGHRSPARATALKMAVQIAYLFMLFCWLLVFNALWMAHVGTDAERVHVGVLHEEQVVVGGVLEQPVLECVRVLVPHPPEPLESVAEAAASALGQ